MRTQIRMVFLLLGCITAGLCQATGNATSRLAPPAPSVYESFFQTVVTLKNVRESNPSRLVQPGLQELTGLADQQMRMLNDLAEDCVAKMPGYSVSGRSVYFESLLRTIDSGQDDSQWLVQRLNELHYQRTKIVSEHVQQLRVRLGEISFQALEAWVSSAFSQHCFINPCGVERR